MAHLPSDIIQKLAILEARLKYAQSMAENHRLSATRRMYWQGRARTLQGQIEVLEEMAQTRESKEADDGLD